jgi:hypothetical protein
MKNFTKGLFGSNQKEETPKAEETANNVEVAKATEQKKVTEFELEKFRGEVTDDIGRKWRVYGLRDKNTGEIIVPAKYNKIDDFVGHVAIVEIPKSNWSNCIDKSGRELLPREYEYIYLSDLGDGIVLLRTDCRGWSAKRHIYVSVEDNGKGMPASSMQDCSPKLLLYIHDKITSIIEKIKQTNNNPHKPQDESVKKKWYSDSGNKQGNGKELEITCFKNFHWDIQGRLIKFVTGKNTGIYVADYRETIFQYNEQGHISDISNKENSNGMEVFKLENERLISENLPEFIEFLSKTKFEW